MARILYDVKIPMRDGVRLSADLFLPAGEGPFPAMFNMTPYGTVEGSEPLMTTAESFVRRGYAYIAVDVRGRYDSEGQWYAHPAAERHDGIDAIDWIARQSWSDGKVATIGHSYSGWNQWPIAQECNPHHVAMASSGSPTNLFQDWPNLDGVLSLQPIATWALGMMYGRGGDGDVPEPKMTLKEALWHLPLSELDTLMADRKLPFWQDWLEHDSLDDFWQPLQMHGNYSRIQIPTFNVSGWYDARLKGQINAYLEVMKTTKDRAQHFLLIGPWLHSPVGQAPAFAMRDFGPQGNLDVAEIRCDWLDHVVQGKSKPELEGVLYFLQVANEWRQAPAWPLPDTRFVKHYLDSDGAANTLHGDGRLRTDRAGEGPADRYTYDPDDPVPTNWSPTRAEGILPTEPQDCRAVEARDDVLVYSTAVLTQDTEVTGPVTATIYFSTDVVDTDITVKLVDVDPQGVAFQLSYGIARARYRNSYARPELLEPGEVYAVDVELQPTSNYFRKGHCIRVEVSSSNFPFYARNLNCGGNHCTTTERKPAHTRILHSVEHPSHIVLPVVPGGSSRVWRSPAS
jgi:putative CocE/NonD family hydrolase